MQNTLKLSPFATPKGKLQAGNQLEVCGLCKFMTEQGFQLVLAAHTPVL